MQRFFVPPETLSSERITLRGPLAHQIARVLRMAAGERLVLLDNSGAAYTVVLDKVTPAGVQAHVEARWQPQTEPSVAVTLYQAIPKGKRWEWVLQKGTELGVTRFVPLVTAHSVVRLSPQEAQGRLARWREIVREAAEQAGRARLPEVEAPHPFEAACQAPPAGALALLACLDVAAQPLRQVLAAVRDDALQEVRLYIGPEGGFAAQEIAQAAAVGIRPISLGPRILRSETAPLAALSALLYALGELDPLDGVA